MYCQTDAHLSTLSAKTILLNKSLIALLKDNQCVTCSKIN